MYRMGNMKVAEARARFGEILDDAEQGVPVIIERRGVRFRLVAEPPAARPRVAKTAVFEYLDPAVRAGQWTWSPGREGAAFSARRKSR